MARSPHEVRDALIATLRSGPVGFGAASLGGLGRSVDRHTAEKAIQAALAAGIRYFDTAPFYGFGLSERRVGDCLRGVPGVVVSTKVGRLLEADGLAETSQERDGYVSPMPFTACFDYSYDGVMRSFEASIQRTGLSRLQILYVHDIGRQTHGAGHGRHWRALFDGGYRALDELRGAGDVEAIGLGLNECEAGVEALREGAFDLVMIAGRYTLLDRSARAELIPACAAGGARLVAAGVYNSGILAIGSDRGGLYDYAPARPDVVDATRALERVCAEFGVRLPAAALQFARAHPLVVTTVPGIASPERVAQTIALLAEPIPAEYWVRLKASGCLEADDITPMGAG